MRSTYHNGTPGSPISGLPGVAVCSTAASKDLYEPADGILPDRLLQYGAVPMPAMRIPVPGRSRMLSLI